MAGDGLQAFTPPVGGRPLLLAGALLGAAGLADVLSTVTAGAGDPYLVVRGETMYRLDITGWAWTHGITGLVTAVVGLLVLTGRRAVVVGATVVAVASVAVDLLILPYEPYRSVLSASLTVAAVRLLVRQVRRGRPAAGLRVTGRSGR